MRNIPQPLYNRALDLALRIANAAEADHPRARRGAYRRLRTLYRARLGTPDPFLTETLDDFTTELRTVKEHRLLMRNRVDLPHNSAQSKHAGLPRASIVIRGFREATLQVQATKQAATVQSGN